MFKRWRQQKAVEAVTRALKAREEGFVQGVCFFINRIPKFI
jgi:hypothetical protein